MSQRIKQLQTFLTAAKPAPITYPHQFQKERLMRARQKAEALKVTA